MFLMSGLIMSLQACTNIGLAEQLESPGASTGQSRIYTLFLFATNNTINGNIKGGYASTREAADDQCQLTRNTLTFPDNGCSKVRGVISLSGADSIAMMPGNYGIPTNRSINGPNNFVLASDWGTLVAGTSGNALTAGNVMSAGTNWWSFSTLGGNYSGTENCSGGMDGTTGTGVVGVSSTAGNTWLATGTAPGCGTPARLLCICY